MRPCRSARAAWSGYAAPSCHAVLLAPFERAREERAVWRVDRIEDGVAELRIRINQPLAALIADEDRQRALEDEHVHGGLAVGRVEYRGIGKRPRNDVDLLERRARRVAHFDREHDTDPVRPRLLGHRLDAPPEAIVRAADVRPRGV